MHVPGRRHTGVTVRAGALACLAAAFALSGCSDGATPHDPIRQPVRADDAALARIAVADASERILPGLDDHPRAAAIAARLLDLSAQLERGDAAGVHRALDRVEEAIAGDDDHPDLAAIRLAIAAVRAILKP